MPIPEQVAKSAIELIGQTPVVRLRRAVPEGCAEVWAKLESMNPGGSVKDRICLAMIEAAERSGELTPGATVVEPTSGNTGIGLALVCAVKGYPLVLTMPDTMSEERRSLLAAYGACLELTPDTKGMHAAIERAREISLELPNAFMPQQFSNPANPEAHRRTTAQEILAQMPAPDAFVAGVGTGGTISGVGSVLKEKRPSTLIAAIEPDQSPVLSGGQAGFHGIQGIGAGFVPDNLDRSVLDRIIRIRDEDAAAATRKLARSEGLLVGISSGANFHAACELARELGPGRRVLTVFCDTGERYLTTPTFQAEEGI